MNKTHEKKSATRQTEDLLELRKHGTPDFPLHVYENFLAALPSQRVDWHWHSEFEISYVVKGTASFNADKKEYILKAGEAILTTHNVLHSVFQQNNAECLFYTIVFSPSVLFNFARTELVDKYYTPLVDNPNTKAIHLKADDSKSQTCLNLIQKIIDVNINGAACLELLTKSYLFELWATLYEQYVDSNPTMNLERPISSDELRVNQAIDYIEENYMNNITLDDIASSIHISKSECCRCFKRVVRSSPVEYLIRFRILEASRRILSSTPESYSMSSLAEAVGFNSTSYFTKLFKKYMFYTPTEYRKIFQDNAAEMDAYKAKLKEQELKNAP